MSPTGLEDELKNTGRTYFLGAKIYISIAVCAVLVVILFSLLVVFSIRYYRKSKKQRMLIKHPSSVMPMISKEILEIKKEEDVIIDLQEEKKDHGRQTLLNSDDKTFSSNVDSNIGWGRWYTLRELEMATEGFSKENVIGEGGYGVVYKGVLSNNITVAVKNLFNHKGQAEKEFRVEVEAIGKVRHRNLAGLVGYCADGPQRLLVYEFVDNGNLEQWLHGDVELKRALTWEIRMKIAIGTAKGLAYLHEGLEPKVVHRDIKSSNILLDKQWNPKVSDFGLAKLLRSGSKYVTTRVMGTFGYVAPDYASSGMLNECSDVYSFGVLLMEIISGRIPVDFQRPVGQVNLVEWFKGMVGSRLMEEVVDPCIEVPPSSRVLRRVFLICLRCIDVDASKRPKMGQIVYMLEGDEFPFRSDNRPIRQTSLAIPDARVV